MLAVKEVIILEGKYDKNKLSGIISADYIETNGFGIFNNAQLRNYIVKVAQNRGIVIFTDPDGAGFQIRNFIKSFVPMEYIKNAYVPAVHGKERRKTKPSAENTLGVEGLSEDIIIKALIESGATLWEADDGETIFSRVTNAYMTPILFYKLGFNGHENSAMRRDKLKAVLNLPLKISTTDLIKYLNIAVSESEFYSICNENMLI